MDVVKWSADSEIEMKMTGESSPGAQYFGQFELQPRTINTIGQSAQILTNYQPGAELLPEVRLTHSGYIEPFLDPQGPLAQRWAKRTLKNYKGLWFNHLKPSLGDLPLESIKVRDVQLAINKVPPKMARNCRDFISLMYSEAVREEILVRNPAQGRNIQLPRIQKTKKDWLPLTTPDGKGIMQLDLGKYQEQFRFMAIHGLRPGEAAVLTPQDIFQDHLGNWRVRICKTHGSDTTKSKYAREMPLLIDAPPSFEKWARDPDTLARHLKPFGIKPHSLRKTAASWMFRKHIDLKTVMTWCGWKDPKLALQIYAEVTSYQEEETAEAIRIDLMSLY